MLSKASTPLSSTGGSSSPPPPPTDTADVDPKDTADIDPTDTADIDCKIGIVGGDYIESIPSVPYVPKEWANFKPPEPAPLIASTDLARNWTYPRGRDLLGDEVPRDDFFNRNNVVFWETLLDVFEGTNKSLSKDVVSQIKHKWKNLYAAFLREKEKRLEREKPPPEDIFNMNLEDMSLDQLFDKLDEAEAMDTREKKIKVEVPDSTNNGLAAGCQVYPGGGIWNGRQPFVDILKEQTTAYKKKLFGKKPIKKY